MINHNPEKIVQLLFTSSETPGSYLIRKVTGEPVSHCALRVDDYVVSAEIKGVIVQPYSVFKANHDIKFILPVITTQTELDKHFGKPYDYLGLLFLGIRYSFPKLMPKQNLWQLSGMFMCTELVSNIVTRETDSMVTPYKLYLKLINNYITEREKPEWQS